MRFHVRNWRCIEDLEIELRSITLFIGRNAAGKSSIAYAAYFLSKLAKWHDANELLLHLYGANINDIVRIDEKGSRCYPLIIEAENTRFEARSSSELTLPERSPWNDEYILPSQRLSFIRIPKFVQELLQTATKPHDRFVAMFLYVLHEAMKSLPLQPPLLLFFDDLVKLFLGKRMTEKVTLGDVGTFVREVTPVLSLVMYDYIDPFTKLKLPMNLAPDGAIDSILLKEFVERASENSLIVIEEPEIHKNPLMIIDLTKELTTEAVNKRLTLVITTHNDILIRALVKLVEDRKLRPEYIAVYYLERNRENPWTRVRELKIYEDGTIEELPDVEKAMVYLL